jgi:hypothetical protein
MATYNLKQFSDPNVLMRISPDNLFRLFEPHAEYFKKRGFDISALKNPPAVDYMILAQILASPDSNTPDALADALYLVHESADTRAMDEILKEAELWDIKLDYNAFSTPADIALDAYFVDPRLLERRIGEKCLLSRRSFYYYQTDQQPLPEFDEPDSDTLREIEGDLDEFYDRKLRGRNTRIIMYVRPDGVWFLIRHGEPLRREGGISQDGKSHSVLYRPERYDVVAYNPAIGELCVNAQTKSEREAYRRIMGLRLFDDEEFFPGHGKYTLEPLRRLTAAEISSSCVDGIERVRLLEIKFVWTDGNKPRRASDVCGFSSEDGVHSLMDRRKCALPENSRIILAKFEVKFTGSKLPRIVTIRPSNVVIYTRDADSIPVEKWLDEKGFIIHREVSVGQETEVSVV